MKSMLSGIILASGFSRRMGRDKLLLPIDGIPMVERVIRAAMASRLDECILVWRNPVVRGIGMKYDLQLVHNNCAEKGQSVSVKLGVACAAQTASGLLFLVADQPYIKSEIIDSLIAGHIKRPEAVLVATYAGRRGNPVLFPASLGNDLAALSGDTGGRAIMARMPERIVEVDYEDSRAGMDIDTPESYQSITSVVKP